MTEVTESGGHEIVIVFGETALADLRDLQQLTDLNPSTVVNRAVQLYAVIDALTRRGGKVYAQEPDRRNLERMIIL